MNQLFGSTVFTWGLNLVFFCITIFVYLTAIQSVKKNTRHNYVEYAPSLMTSLGLFGTFLGIFIGLLNFDPNHIDSSIKLLLNGLQTAFITSIMGMFFAGLFKVRQTHILDMQPDDGDLSAKEVGPQEIYAVLTKQYNSIVFLVKAIGGDGERSMVGQLQMLRTEVTDFRSGIARRQEDFEEKLWLQLNSFAEMLSKSATEQVIEALKLVIVEFNEKLTEQFGDNFKRLDESVKKLVDWQANYMQQLDEMTKQYSLGVQAIDLTRNALQEIRVETAKIPVNMEALGEVVHVNQHQIGELNRHLEAFVAMRDQAVMAVPQIQQKLEEVGSQLREGAQQVNMVLIQGSEQFQNSVQQTNQSMVKTASEVANQSEQISKELTDAFTLLSLNTERIRTGITTTISAAMEAVEVNTKKMTLSSGETANLMLSNVQKTVQDAVQSVEKSRQAMQQSIEAVNQSVVQHTDRSLGGVEKQVQEAVNRTNDAVNSQLRQLDEALSKQLNAALQELGSSLATITNHMVKTVYEDKQRQAERARVGA